MTNKVKGFTVTLEEDFREDDVERIMNAIKMIRGVLHVEPSIVTSEDHIQRIRIKTELMDRFVKSVKEL